MNSAQQTVCQHILSQILDGRIDLGARLPTETELAERFQTNRMNVHRAMKTLENHKILERRRRHGTFVRSDFRQADAVALRNMTADRVAVLLTTDTTTHVHWNSHTLTDFERLLNERDYRVDYRPFPADRDAFRACLDELAGAGYRGVVLLPTSENAQVLLDCMDLIENQPLNVYLMNRGDIPNDRCRCHMLCLDPFDEGIQVARFIASRGWQTIAFLETDRVESVFWVQERKAGLVEGLRTASPDSLQAQTLYVGTQCEGFKLSEVVRTSDHDAPVLVTQNDALAAQLLKLAAAEGWEVGRDFYLVSFDDDPLYRPYNLTTVSPPLSEMAAAFADVLCGNGITTPSKSQVIIKLKSRLIERGTSGSRQTDTFADPEIVGTDQTIASYQEPASNEDRGRVMRRLAGQEGSP